MSSLGGGIRENAHQIVYVNKDNPVDVKRGAFGAVWFVVFISMFMIVGLYFIGQSGCIYVKVLGMSSNKKQHQKHYVVWE